MSRDPIFARDGWKCVNCGAGENLTIDHKVPRSRGGSDLPANKQTLCLPCNAGKANKMPGQPFRPDPRALKRRGRVISQKPSCKPAPARIHPDDLNPVARCLVLRSLAAR